MTLRLVAIAPSSDFALATLKLRPLAPADPLQKVRTLYAQS